MFIPATGSPELIFLGVLTLIAFGIAPIAVAGIGAAASALANLFAPQGEDLQSFSGQMGSGVSVDPKDILGKFLSGMGTYGKYMTERAEQPFQFSPSVRVQSPNWYSGGGLPMAIGVGGVDQGYYSHTGFGPTYPRGGPGKTMGNGPFGAYGEVGSGDTGTGTYTPEGGWGTGGGGGGGGDDEGDGGGPPPMAYSFKGDENAAASLAGAPEPAADGGPQPTAADFRNMLAALRGIRGEN